MKNLISIIVPAYNIASCLGSCLDSILAQTYRELEIFVVDDGSTDLTGAIADEYAKKDARIRVIHQENRGLSGARNAALPLVNGEYIGFVDGDDRIAPEMYEAMITAAVKEGAALSCCAYRTELWDGGTDPDETFSGETYVLSRKEALSVFVCDDRPFHIYYSVWSKLFRRDLIGDLSFPERRNSEDILFSTKALLRSKKTVFVDRPLYFYSAGRPDSIMNVKLEARRFDDEIPFLREQISLLKESGFKELSEKAEYAFYRRMLFYYTDFRLRGMKEAAARLYQSVKKEKERVKELYFAEHVKRGDRARMRLFLTAPGIYYQAAKLYEQKIVPVRSQR